MFNKNDPLINSVKKIMEENELRRQAELDLNEELGIASKRALPHEHHKNYDALLEQKIAEALHPNQQKLDVHEPEKDKLTSQDFKLLRAKKGIKEAIGDKEGTAGTLRKNGKPFVPDTLANSPFMQASPDKAPMPPERPKDLDKQAPTPPARPKDLNEISRNLARRVIRKASDEKEMDSKKDRSKAVELAGKKAYSIPSEPKVRATNEETLSEENHVLYTHPKADIKVVRKGEGSKEGAAIEVHKGGKKVASGDYDRGADAFFMNVGGKGQKSFDTAKDIANHFHGLSEQFQQLDEKAPEGAKFERMVKHIKAGYSKDGKLTDKEKSIAYATAWKAKNKNMEEGITAEQVMAEIKKNLGEDKFNEVNEGVWNSIKDTVSNIGTGIKNALTPTPNNTVPDPEGTVERPGQAAQSRMAPVSTVSSTTPRTTAPASNKAAEMGNDERTSPAPSVDKNVDTGSGTAPPSKPTTPAPKPRAAAPKPAATAAKDDIWDDSKIQRTGEGGTETAADFQRNSELYKQRLAAGGQRPAPEAPKPATPSAPKPATPTATSSVTNRSSDMAAGRAAERGDNRTNLDPRNTLARPTKPAPIRESLNDAITKILKG